MKEFSPIEQLDAILKVLYEYDKAQLGMSLASIIYHANTIEEGKTLPFTVLQLVITKLIKDDYVKENVSKEFNTVSPLTDKNYFITFEGLVFHQQGGYANKIILDSENEKRIVRNEKWLLRGNWFAGIAAFLVLLWQIFLYFYPVHKDYPIFFWQK